MSSNEIVSRPRIEILSVRDPDSSTEVTMFIDGVPATDYAEVDVDPGAGHEIQDWLQAMVEIELGDYSPAFKAAALQAYADHESSSYIMGDASEAVVTCTHGEGVWPDRTFCRWEHPFENVTAAAAALREHRESTHAGQA